MDDLCGVVAMGMWLRYGDTEGVGSIHAAGKVVTTLFLSRKVTIIFTLGR